MMCMQPYQLPSSLHRGLLSAPLGRVHVGEASLRERGSWRTKLSDDGVAGVERHSKIAGLLRTFSVRLNSKSRSSQGPVAKGVGRGTMQMYEKVPWCKGKAAFPQTYSPGKNSAIYRGGNWAYGQTVLGLAN